MSEETAIILSAAALSAAGVAFALFATTLARRAADIMAVVAGALLLLVAIFHLAPEAIASGGYEFLFLLGGAAIGVALELQFHGKSGAVSDESARLAARVGVLVLALHSMLDGAVYTAAFWHGESTGLLTSLGLIVHEAPEGIVAVMLCLQGGLRPASAAIVAILASTATTPLGWGAAHAVGAQADGVMRAMFAASAGLLLYVGWRLMSRGWSALRASRRDRA